MSDQEARSAAQGRCLCAERGLLGIHEQECEGFGSRSDELCEQAEREARAAGEWPPESPAATTETRCWELTIVVSFQADNAEDAEAISSRMLDLVVEHPAAIEGEAACRELK